MTPSLRAETRRYGLLRAGKAASREAHVEEPLTAAFATDSAMSSEVREPRFAQRIPCATTAFANCSAFPWLDCWRGPDSGGASSASNAHR